MKPQNVLALFLCSFALGERSVRAEIYKYVDPATGAVEYTVSPKQGAVRLSNGDTLSEIRTGAKADHASVCGSPPKTLATEVDVDAEKERIAKCNQEREDLSAIHRKIEPPMQPPSISSILVHVVSFRPVAGFAYPGLACASINIRMCLVSINKVTSRMKKEK